LKDYRSDESDDSVKINEENIMTWICQFEENERLIILQEMDNIKSDMIFTHLKDCWRFVIDVDVANKLYETKPSLSVEDLCIALGCLQRQEKKAFYNVCLLDYTELPMECMEEFSHGKDHEFILLENKNIYPEVYCKMELFASTKA